MEAIKFSNLFDIKIEEKSKQLPSMYWIPKMHKKSVGTIFIIPFKKCTTKPLSKIISNILKVIYKHVESFHKTSRLFSETNKFWVVQNCFPFLNYLNKINVRKKATRISTFDFATLYITISHDLLIDVLKDIICFVFDSSYRNKLGFSQNSLVKNCYFTVGNNILKHIT